MWFGALGRLSVISDTGDEIDVGPPQRRELLALLLTRPNRLIPIDQILEALWPAGFEPAKAKTSVHSHVSRLRGLIGSDRIVTRHPGYLLRVAPDDFDALDFEDSLLRASSPPREELGATTQRLLKRILDLWRGEPFEDFVYADWAQAEIRRLLDLRRSAMKQWADLSLDAGMYPETIPSLRAETHRNPDDEELTRLLAKALYMDGRASEALECIESLRIFLREELGLTPSSKTQRLESDILNDRDLSGPFEEDARLPATVSTAPTRAEQERRGNLPVVLSEFVGRTFSVAELADLLETKRLITITGAAGAGKTRLANRVAMSIADRFPDGVWLIDLDNADGLSGVVETATRDLSFVWPTRPSVPTLIEALATRSCLLLLDNCESAIDGVAIVAERLLQECPHIRVLATSREPLAIPGETIWRISPLDVPTRTVTSVDELLTYEAVVLLAVRARNADPGFRVTANNAEKIVQISRTLDGLPLAIEMAAMQLHSRSLDDLVEDLGALTVGLKTPYRTGPARHRTLNFVIDSSFDRLTRREQSFLETLSVFEGSFNVTAAAAASQLPVSRTKEFLETLLRQSLIGLAPEESTRFRLLVPVRTRLRERAGPKHLRNAQHAVAELIAHKSDLSRIEVPAGINSVKWYQWGLENENLIQQSLEWSIDADVQIAERTAIGFAWFYPTHGPWSELLARLHTILTEGPNRTLLEALLARRPPGGDVRIAEAFAQEVLDKKASAPGEATLIATMRMADLAMFGEISGADFETVVETLESLRGLVETPLRDAELEHHLGRAYLLAGHNIPEGMKHTERAIKVARQAGLEWMLAILHNDHGEALRLSGRHLEALTENTIAAQYARRYRRWHVLSVVLQTQAELEMIQGSGLRAAQLAFEAAEIAHRYAIPAELVASLEILAYATMEINPKLSQLAHDAAHWALDRRNAQHDVQSAAYHPKIEESIGTPDPHRFQGSFPEGLTPGLKGMLRLLGHVPDDSARMPNS